MFEVAEHEYWRVATLLLQHATCERTLRLA